MDRAQPGAAIEDTKGRDGAPELSVILVCDHFEQGREMIEHLRAQTAHQRLELVLVTPEEPDAEQGELLRDFGSVIRVPSEGSLSDSRVVGVNAANAPIVAMVETHCFPAPDWAEHLIAAHRGPWAAVGPSFENENPELARSWASLVVDYGPWLAPRPPGPVDDLPGNNSSYKRGLLLGYGDQLSLMLAAETVMHWDLRKRGHRLFLESRARVRHRNATKPGAAAVMYFLYGRCFAGGRARRWRPLTRALWVVASPLIPLVRLQRALAQMRRAGHAEMVPRALPMLVLGLLASAAGELAGYASGPGDAAARISKYELDRNSYLAELAEAT